MTLLHGGGGGRWLLWGQDRVGGFRLARNLWNKDVRMKTLKDRRDAEDE